jgi:hypothetical protein
MFESYSSCTVPLAAGLERFADSVGTPTQGRDHRGSTSKRIAGAIRRQLLLAGQVTTARTTSGTRVT